jgi:hypothetical protein
MHRWDPIRHAELAQWTQCIWRSDTYNGAARRVGLFLGFRGISST